MNAVEQLARARASIRNGQAKAGLDALRSLVVEFPGYAEGWFVRSGTESGLGLGLSAVASARRALELEPGNPLHRAHAAQMQVNYGLWGDALATLASWQHMNPANFESRIANSVGSVLSLCGREDTAQPWFAAAVKQTPDNQNYLYNEAQGLLHCGRTPDSVAAFERLLARFPDFAKGHWSLSTVQRAERGAERLATLKAAVTRAASPVDEVMYCYAMFNVLDAMNRPREAFAELQHGMRLQRARIRYAGQDVAAMRSLGEIGERLLREHAVPEQPPAAEPAGSARPLFIVGLPRSGTTLVERILGNHPDVAQGGELMCFGGALREQLGIESAASIVTSIIGSVPPATLAGDVDLAAVGARYLELAAYKLRGKASFTDKFPFNFMLVPWIALALPQARILHIRRDPLDTCFSNLKQLFAGGYGACYSQQDIAEFFQAYHELMQLWDRLLPGRILQVKQEQLIADPERNTARIFDFCGLRAVNDAWRIENNTQPVATASATQVREPINAKGIGAWRRYETELAPLVEFFRTRPQLAE